MSKTKIIVVSMDMDMNITKINLLVIFISTSKMCHPLPASTPQEIPAEGAAITCLGPQELLWLGSAVLLDGFYALPQIRS